MDNQNLIEEKLNKAIGLSAEGSECLVVLIFAFEQDAIDAYELLIENLQKDEFSIHVKYNRNDLNFSLISTSTGNCVNANGLHYSPHITSILDFISLSINNKNHPQKDYISLFCCITENGKFVSPKDNSLGMRNIKSLTLEIVE